MCTVEAATVLIAHQPIKIRLEGIDTPEKGQPYGDKAKQAVSRLVFGVRDSPVKHRSGQAKKRDNVVRPREMKVGRWAKSWSWAGAAEPSGHVGAAAGRHDGPRAALPSLQALASSLLACGPCFPSPAKPVA